MLSLTSPVKAEQTNQALNITMVLWRGETLAEQGFKDRLKALGYHFRIRRIDANQDRNKLASQLRQEHREILASDYVYSFGTTATRMLKSLLRDRTPHIYNIVTDPVGAQISKAWSGSGGNRAGISHASSLEQQLKTARRLKNFKRLGLFYNPQEANSELTLKKLRALSDRQHFEVIELRCPPGTERLQRYLQDLANGDLKLDAVYLPLDSYLLSHAALVGNSLRRAGVFSIGAQRDYIVHGALFGLVPDYYRLGQAAADYLDQHHRGKPLSMLPVYRMQQPQLLINQQTFRALQLDKAPIPDQTIRWTP